LKTVDHQILGPDETLVCDMLGRVGLS
jgi:hypothetical protein